MARITRIMLAAWAAGILASSGCRECTLEARSGLGVVVRDAATGSRLCDATVLASEGSYQETLRSDGAGADCSFAGAWERAGTYRLVVSHAGYQTQERVVVVQDEDGCHVRGESLIVDLAP